jgi:hypothetical protein
MMPASEWNTNVRSDVADEAAGGPPRAAGMVIRLAIEQTEPLTGTAANDSGEPVHFVGWLAMLKTISELIEAPSCGGTAAEALPTAQTTGGHDLS